MAGSRNINARVAIEGDAAFKQALKAIDSELRVSESALSALSAKFAESANTEEALTAKTAALRKDIENYEKKVSTLRDAVENARKAQKNWENEITKTKSSLSDTRAKIDALDSSTQRSGQQWNALQKQLQNAKAELSNLQKTSGDTSQEEARLTEEISKLENQLSELDAATEGAASAAGKLYKDEENLTGALARQEAKFETAQTGANNYETQLNKAEAKMYGLNNELTKNERYLEEARNASDHCATSIDKYGKQVKESADASRDNADATKETADAMQALSTIIMTVGLERALRLISDAFKECVGNAADFEYAMKTVEAVSGASESQLGALSNQALELAASTIYTAQETSQAYVTMARAGWETEDMLDSMAGVMNLASAAGEDLSGMTKVVVDGLIAFGYSSDQAARFADVLASAAANSDTTVAQLGESMSIVGNMAGTLNYSIEDVSVALGIMANSGLDASVGATGLTTALTRMSGSNATATKAMKELHLTMFDDGEQAKELSVFLGELRAAFSGMTDEQKINTAAQLAGQRGMKSLLAIVNASTEDWNKLTDSINNSTGAAEQMADIQLDSFTGQMKLLESAAEGLEIEVGSQLNPALKDLASAGTDATNGIKDLIVEHKAIVPVAAGAATGLATMTTAVTLGTVAVRVYQAAVTAGLVGTIGAIAAPAALAAVAIGALTTAIIYSKNNISEEEQQLRAFRDAVEETSGAISDHISAYTDYRAGAESAAASNGELINTLQSLVQSYNGTNSAAVEINAVIDQLNQSVPSLNLAFDEQTGTLNMTADALELMASKYQVYNDLVSAIEHRNTLRNDTKAAGEQAIAAKAAYDDAVAALQSYRDELSSGFAQYDESKIQSLTLAVNNTSAAWETAKQAANDAKNAYADAETQVQSLKNEYDGLTDSVDENTSATDAAVSAEDRLAQKRAEQQAAAEAEAAANEEANKKLLEIKSAANNAIASGGNLRDTYDALSKEYAALNGAGNEYLAHLVEEKLRMIEQGAIAQELGENYGALANVAGIGLSELSGYIQENGLTAESWASSVQSATDSIVNDFGKVSTSLDMSLSEMATNLQYNIDAYSNWNSNISALMDAAVASGSDAAILFVQHMQEMGIGAADQVALMVDNLGYTFDTLAPLYAAAVQEAMATGNTELLVGAEAAKGAAEPVANAIPEAISEADTAGATEAIMDDVVSAIDGSEGNVTSSAQTVAQSAASAMEEKSGDFINIGKAYDQNLASGIAANGNVITIAARAAAANASYAFYELSWYNIGYNISAGVATGVSGGSYLIANAAAAAAQKAYSSAKSKLGIHSPSTVMAELGYFTDAGLAKGITDNLKMIENASQLLASAAVPDIDTSSLYSLTPDLATARGNAATGQAAQNVEEAVYKILSTYLPQLLSAARQPITMNGEVVAQRTDQWQGQQKIYRDRGN